jgi:uncharacterized protein (UPF0548 family)
MRSEQSLRERPLSYGAVGATLAEDRAVRDWPGFSAYEGSACIGSGTRRWEHAAREVLRWGVKVRSGFTVEDPAGARGDGARVAARDRYWLVAHLGPLRIVEPVEVVAVVDAKSAWDSRTELSRVIRSAARRRSSSIGTPTARYG